MITDANLLFSSDQVITSTDLSTKSVDLGAALSGGSLGRDIGPGETIGVFLRVTEAFTALTTLTVTLVSSAAAALTGTTIHWSKALAVADLTLNSLHQLPDVPAGIALRYLGLNYTVGGTATGPGKVTTGLTFKSMKPENYGVKS